MATQGVTLNRAPASPSAPTQRRHELDWLRAFVVLGLIPAHAAVIFSSTADLYIKNSQTSQLMALLGAFAGAWGMPLLFLVAGAGAYFALNRRTGGAYLKERVTRLLVPFVFATLVIVPVQVYALARAIPNAAQAIGVPIHDPNFLSSYPAFYVEYLRDYLYFLTHFSTSLAIVFWGHLWFIPRLFAYALCTLPLFFFFKSSRGQRMIEALSGLLRHRGAIFLFAIPLMLVETLARVSQLNALTAHWPLYDDWIQFAFYLVYFIYGYLVFAIGSMPGAITRHGWVALGLGAVGFTLALTQTNTLAINPLSYSLGYIFGLPIRGFVGWFWVVAILSLALRRLGFTNGLLRYLNDAAFPIYVLHMPIVTVVGVYVIGFDIPWALKFALIIIIALTLTVGLYEVAVRRIRVMRALFGLKPRRPSDAPRRAPPRRSLGPSTTGGHEYAR